MTADDTFAQPTPRPEASESTNSETSPDGVAWTREESRLIDGKAMSPESIAMERHLMEGSNGSGESGSQGNTLGRENQNTISAPPVGRTSSPDRSQSDEVGHGDER